MAVIYLRHPKHGTKVATLDVEAAYDEQHGWERYEPDEPVSQDEDDAPPAARRGRRRRVDESDKEE